VIAKPPWLVNHGAVSRAKLLADSRFLFPLRQPLRVRALRELTRVCFADARAAERAGFEPAEEREPLAGLANRCLGPLDYLSESAFYRVEIHRATAIRHPIRVRALHELARACCACGQRRGRDSNPRGLAGLPVFKTGGFVRSPTPPDSDYTGQSGGIRIPARSWRSFLRRGDGARRTGRPTARA
jgi:hypothetical protein